MLFNPRPMGPSQTFQRPQQTRQQPQNAAFAQPTAQAPGASRFGNVMNTLFDPQVALPMAAALMGNQGNTANFGNAFAAAGPSLQKRKELEAQTAQKNQTVEFLRQNAPEYAQAVEAGMPVGDAWKAYTQQREVQKPTDTMRNLEWRAKNAGLQPGTPEYAGFMATGGSSPDESAANQRIDRMAENLMATGDFVDPQEAKNIAVGIVDGRLKSDRHPVTGELQIVDMATGRPVYGGRQQPSAQTPAGPEAPAPQEDRFGRQYPASNEAFGVPGAIAGGINRASDAIGVGPVYPEIQQSQADFGVLRESLMNDISSAYNRQPPSWLMKEIRGLTPAAGSPFEGPSGAVSKLNALGRHLENELRITENALAQRELSPKNRQELEAKRDGLGAGLERITGAIHSFGDREQRPARAPEPGTIEEGYRFKGGDPANPDRWERVQ